MTIDILTIFPEMFQGVLNASILGRARAKGLLTIEATDIRPYSESKHKNTDDYPFGGGAGMLMTPQPIASAIRDVCRRRGVRCPARDGGAESPEEAALTAEALGNEVLRLYDVGVAGLHRLLAHLDEIMSASVIIAIAGMEGALASVIGGLADCPVIAVPTSVGYGASFHGLSALLSMLNSCASGVSVVNIDNGFGAGYLASMINHMEAK